jgi:hypothetical protein
MFLFPCLFVVHKRFLTSEESCAVRDPALDILGDCNKHEI